jgi:uncharacterized protein
MKEIDLKKSLFDITEAYPELIPVLAEVGFQGVTNERMRTTHAKIMTLPKGCEQLGIDLAKVVKRLEAEGFRVKR